ncbi:EBNA-3C [macacine gammaherpesvirus 10]|uniref:EBNA-3C n=1 Tax=macacine gammaherpesvirus 10 TaxID=2560569 RepID=A0A0S0DZY7_9GAMA|nr:EBNA-3C [macacine gammaherpesvirus 10]ALF03233.1 EBNA-3C [macacine gammaherpesvirus 10]
MASQGEGDDIHSTQEEPGDKVQQTGELAPGTGSQAGEPPTVTTQWDEGTAETGQQAGRGEQETWMQHVRQRRRRRHERAGGDLGGVGVELPWLPPFVTRPYSAVELMNAAYETVSQPATHALANLMFDRNVDPRQTVCFLMAARQRCRDLERGPSAEPGWRHWVLTSPSVTWYMGFRTASIRTRTSAPDRIGADIVKVMVTMGCHTGARSERAFSAQVWTPYLPGAREQERFSREAEAFSQRRRWQRRYRVIFDLIATEHSLRHIWLHRLQSEDQLFDFARFMGAMTRCGNPALKYWWHKSIGTYKPSVPWYPRPNEQAFHTCRGLNPNDLKATFRQAQRLGLRLLEREEPDIDDIVETSSEEEGSRDSDSQVESSDDELPYIAPGMERPRKRPLIFIYGLPWRTRPWPTCITHPAVPSLGVDESSSDDMEHDPSPPGEPGPPDNPPAPTAPPILTQVEHPTVIVHQPPRAPPAEAIEDAPQRVGVPSGACAVTTAPDIIEVIDVESSDEEEAPAPKRRAVVSTVGVSGTLQKARPSKRGRPKASQPEQPQKKCKDGAPASTQREKQPKPSAPPSKFRELLRERLMERPSGPKPKSFWEMRASRDGSGQQQGPASRWEPSPQRPTRLPSVFALPSVPTMRPRSSEEPRGSPLSAEQPTSRAEQFTYEDSSSSRHAYSEYDDIQYSEDDEEPKPQEPKDTSDVEPQPLQDPPPGFGEAQHQSHWAPPLGYDQQAPYPGYWEPRPQTQHPRQAPRPTYGEPQPQPQEPQQAPLPTYGEPQPHPQEPQRPPYQGYVELQPQQPQAPPVPYLGYREPQPQPQHAQQAPRTTHGEFQPQPQEPPHPPYLGYREPQPQQSQDPRAPYPNYGKPQPQHPQAMPIPYLGYGESQPQQPRPPPAPYPGYGVPRMQPLRAPHLGYRELQPQAPAPYLHPRVSVARYPGASGRWGPWAQYQRHRHPWAYWSQYPSYGTHLPPWAQRPPYPSYPHSRPTWAPYSRPAQTHPLHPQAAPLIPEQPQAQQMPYSQAPDSATALPLSSTPREAPLRPIPTRLPTPSTPLQDSMTTGATAPGTSHPSVIFASNLSQGAFTQVATGGPHQKRPHLEDSHLPARCLDEAAEETRAPEVISEDSDVSEGQEDTQPTDYDASTESDLE